MSHARPHGCICAQVRRARRPHLHFYSCVDGCFRVPACVTGRNLVASARPRKCLSPSSRGAGKADMAMREMTFFRRGSSGSRMFAVDRTLLFRRCRISRRDTNHAPYALFAPRKSAQPVSRKLAARGEN